MSQKPPQPQQNQAIEPQKIITDKIEATLWPIHQDHLLNEGFKESQIYLMVKDLGVRSIGEQEAIELGFKVADESRKNTRGFVSSSGIYFPFSDKFGQLRCDDPPTRNGKPCKYLTPIGQRSAAWLPTNTKVVTEGFKDAAAGTLIGNIPTGAIAGVSHYRKALPKDCGHTILFDSDGWQNPPVFAALVSAAAWCSGKIQLVPEIEGAPKAGLCEFFKAGNNPEDYQKLIAGAISISEFLLELPNHWGEMPTKYLARALRTISVLGAKYLSPTELAILSTRLKRFGKNHEIPASEVTRSINAAQSSEQTPEKRSTADQLIDIGRSGSAVYFQTPEGVVYADLIGNGQRQTVALRSKDFRNYLRAQLFDKTGKSPGSDAVQQAIDTLEALNLRDCPKRELNNRTARDGDTVYLDLANDSWQAIKITSAGWAIETDYPVRFRRGGCAPLATPTSGGNLEDLRTLLQLDHENWVKVLCWIVQSMMPSKEYPILVVTGARGSGKTTLTKAIKRIIDPTTPLTRGSVGTVRDFAIHASKRHTIAIDNISGLNAEQSDILCRSATGDGHAERLLHTDDEEIIFEFVNPLILNGIGSIATRDDLLDRSIVVNLQPLSDRSSADKYQKALETLQPEIFGALLDLLAKVLAILPEVTGTYSGDERFTGFVEIALAVEKAMAWETGTVLNTFATARQNAHQTAVESSPLGEAVLEFMDGRECYTGTASELLSQLNSIVTDRTKRDRSWPANGRWLSDRLCNRLAPDLKALGLEVSRDRGGSARLITIERVAVAEVPAIQPATEEFTELEAAEIKNCIEIAEVAATATPETVVIAWQALKQLTSDRLKRAVWAGLSIAARNALTQAKQADKGKLVEVGQW